MLMPYKINNLSSRSNVLRLHHLDEKESLLSWVYEEILKVVAFISMDFLGIQNGIINGSVSEQNILGANRTYMDL